MLFRMVFFLFIFIHAHWKMVFTTKTSNFSDKKWITRELGSFYMVSVMVFTHARCSVSLSAAGSCVPPPPVLPAAALEDSRTRVWLIRTNRWNNQAHWFPYDKTVSFIPHCHMSRALHTRLISALRSPLRVPAHRHKQAHPSCLCSSIFPSLALSLTASLCR